MGNVPFTVEEENLICIYHKHDRHRTIAAISDTLSDMHADMPRQPMMAAASRVFYFRFDNVDKAFISRIQSSLSLIWLVRPCTNQCRFALLGSDSEKLLFSNNSFEYSYIESQHRLFILLPFPRSSSAWKLQIRIIRTSVGSSPKVETIPSKIVVKTVRHEEYIPCSNIE